MTGKLKKVLLPNLPYVLFAWLFDKLCQAVRLAPGADASEKLLRVFRFQVHRQPDERRPGHAQQQVQRMQAEPEGGKGLGEALGDTKQLFRSVRPR